MAQARTERNAALAAADDDDVGLRLVAKSGGFRLAFFAPGLAIGVVAVFRPIGRFRPLGSSCPLSSLIVVNSVQIRPFFRRIWP